MASVAHTVTKGIISTGNSGSSLNPSGRDSSSTLTYLPHEVLEMILNRLDSKQLGRLEIVSKSMRNNIRDNNGLRQVWERDFHQLYDKHPVSVERLIISSIFSKHAKTKEVLSMILCDHILNCSKEKMFRETKKQMLAIDENLRSGRRSSHHFPISLKDAMVIYNAFDPVSGNFVLCVSDLSRNFRVFVYDDKFVLRSSFAVELKLSMFDAIRDEGLINFKVWNDYVVVLYSGEGAEEKMQVMDLYGKILGVIYEGPVMCTLNVYFNDGKIVSETLPNLGNLPETFPTVFEVYDIPSCSHTASIALDFDQVVGKVCHAGDLLLARITRDDWVEEECEWQPFVAIWSLDDGTLLQRVDFTQNVARSVSSEDIEIRYPYVFHFSSVSKFLSSGFRNEAKKIVALGRIDGNFEESKFYGYGSSAIARHGSSAIAWTAWSQDVWILPRCREDEDVAQSDWILCLDAANVKKLQKQDAVEESLNQTRASQSSVKVTFEVIDLQTQTRLTKLQIDVASCERISQMFCHGFQAVLVFYRTVAQTQSFEDSGREQDDYDCVHDCVVRFIITDFWNVNPDEESEVVPSAASNPRGHHMVLRSASKKRVF